MQPSLYIHVPFCASKCAYCNFYSEPPRDAGAFLSALAADLAREGEHLGAGPLPSVFVGGGTPSLLPAAQLRALLNLLAPFLGPACEFSVECNPEDLSEELLELLCEGGVNRLSLGLQSLSDVELRYCGRRHDAAGARRALALAAASGLRWSADLIIGLPGQAETSFFGGLEEVLAWEPGHLSVYCLELDEPVPLAKLFAEQPELDPGDEYRADVYLELHRRLAAAGYEAYEISNWARPGERCRHNLAIWRGASYLGLGPGAHSFLGGERFSRPSDLELWQSRLLAGRPAPRKGDERGEGEQELERLLLGLRGAEGLPADDPVLGACSLFRDRLLHEGWALMIPARGGRGARFRLSPEGWLRLDAILAGFRE